MSLFLTAEELVELTGRKRASLQIAELKRMLIPYRVNAIGHPVVTRVAVEGGRQVKEERKAWEPGR